MNSQKYTRKLSHPVRRFFAVTIPVVLLLIVGQYAVLSIVAVRDNLKMLYDQEDVKLLSGNIPADSTWFMHYKDKTWLETRYQISRTDSISLSVNLGDSTLQLELKGVVLKRSKILDFRADQIFSHLNEGAYHHFFGVQAVAESALSTIEKEPLIVKNAPKDTIEYAEQEHVIGSAKSEVVHWLLQLDNGIVLKIEGADKLSNDGGWMGRKFWWKQDFMQLKKDIQKTLFFEIPDYKPEIAMVISEADAKAIFRALPTSPLICIRF